MKEIHRWQTFKKLERIEEGDVSKKKMWKFQFYAFVGNYDNFKKFASNLISKNTAFEHKI